jgi:hypothetical protein
MNPHTEEELNENICREIFESSSGRRSVCMYIYRDSIFSTSNIVKLILLLLWGNTRLLVLFCLAPSHAVAYNRQAVGAV